MRRSLTLSPLLGVSLLSASPLLAQLPVPATRAERTNYAETSHHADVLAFLDTLQARRAPLVVTELGRSSEGRMLPLVIASRPQVRTPAEARALRRPVVYVQGNIHAGEVEGKEAVLALLRDLSFARGPNVLDSIVLLVVPNYNADGNERFADQAQQRGAQNGPALVGQRPNAMGLDLNRDYIKAEAPETRAALAAFVAWQPDVFVDLHTTNGSYHGYHLTYSPSLHPSAPLAPFTGDTMLVTIRERMQARHGFRIFPYGNFTGESRRSMTDTLKTGWVTYEHKPRFGTNYFGLRGPISILSEAYSHDPFSVRVASTRAFVQEILSYVAEQPRAVLDRVAAARRQSTFGARGAAPALALRSRFASRPDTQPVLVERLERLPDSTVRDEPGMPLGLKRTGRFAAVRMPVVDRFEAELERRPPAGGWVIEAAVLDSVGPRLAAHGVTVQRVTTAFEAEVEQFRVDSLSQAARPFQGHREVTLVGAWERRRVTVPAGAALVRTGTSLDRLAALLLEPESDDGLATWNLMDHGLQVGRSSPVWRLVTTP
ncbi:MAG: M14 family metallopeptidase [Gemmatimonadaceae bacterium]|jgi:hypothetical protein|nr:M14 family metallopeptidase [Gemmatimonadaceae bacterium]